MSNTLRWFRRRKSETVGVRRRARQDCGWIRDRVRGGHQFRLDPLLLEDRCLLSNVFTVTSIADTSPANNPAMGTLRWAIEQANASSAGATINFSLNTPATIVLGQGPLVLADQSGTLAIDGPGTGLLTISGNGQSNVFAFSAIEQPAQTASISNLTIADGSINGAGGGIFNAGSMMLTGVTITGSTAGSKGGGVYNRGVITMFDCQLLGNSAGNHGGGTRQHRHRDFDQLYHRQ